MPDALRSIDLPADWFILLLRVLFIFLVYFFLYQLLRVQVRELLALAVAGRREETPASHRLVVVEGGEDPDLVGASFVLKPSNLVGRHPQCTIEIDEPFVSSEHAEIAFDDGGWWLRDLGSTNGTFLNGQPVRSATGVEPGDVVQFGRVKLRLVA